MKKHLVLSAVNLTEGGPLTILRNCLSAAKESLSSEWRISVIVHSASLIDIEGVEVLAFPNVKKRWLYRLIFEWWYLRKLSENLNADLWLSLHDITPIVKAKRHAVYCHNASPFYKIRASDLLHSRVLVAMRLLYGYLYSVNIHRNDFVIVQQEWLRKEFQNRYNLNNIIVAYPQLSTDIISRNLQNNSPSLRRFFFPSLPRNFKNFEIIYAASAQLWKQGIRNFEVRLTTTPDENLYIHQLSHKYKHLTCIKYLGRLSYNEVLEEYRNSDALLFPSKLETWGLPLSEAKTAGLPIICSDLPYAHEAVGTYDNVRFCNFQDVDEWSEQMLSLIDNKWSPLSINFPQPQQPFCNDWKDLFHLLIAGL